MCDSNGAHWRGTYYKLIDFHAGVCVCGVASHFWRLETFYWKMSWAVDV